MKLKSIFGIGLTVASLYFNAQQHPKGKENPDTKVNKKYLKHIQDITTAYQKNVKFARNTIRNHLMNITCRILSLPWILKPEQ